MKNDIRKKSKYVISIKYRQTIYQSMRHKSHTFRLSSLWRIDSYIVCLYLIDITDFDFFTDIIFHNFLKKERF